MNENTTEQTTTDTTGKDEKPQAPQTQENEAEETTHEETNHPETQHDSTVEEAKKYRKRAQKAEEERDTLTQELQATRELLTSARHSIVNEQLKAAKMIHPEDFQTFVNAPMDDYFTEEGTLDTEKLNTAIHTLKSTRYELFQRSGLPLAVPQLDRSLLHGNTRRSPLADALRGE
ncbi:MAG: hypothetical protein SOI64_07545 [Bifidobacterium mongoliense]|jgi:hypothetical protein|uniref:hypothetical protein n=1 Tax=Bifidobacterium mongoliense TaxID=518643 RepID=UPI002F360BA3